MKIGVGLSYFKNFLNWSNRTYFEKITLTRPISAYPVQCLGRAQQKPKGWNRKPKKIKMGPWSNLEKISAYPVQCLGRSQQKPKGQNGKPKKKKWVLGPTQKRSRLKGPPMLIRSNEKFIKSAHRGARTHDHKVKSLALYRLSQTGFMFRHAD